MPEISSIARSHGAQLLDGSDAAWSSLDHLLPQAMVDQNRHRRSETTSAAICDSTSRRFSSSLLMSISSPAACGEADVLPLLADGEGKLGVVHDDLHVLFVRIDDADAADFGGAERMRGEATGSSENSIMSIFSRAARG